MSKPQWKPTRPEESHRAVAPGQLELFDGAVGAPATAGRFCRNCGWRLVKQAEDGRSLGFCSTCESVHGGQPGKPFRVGRKERAEATMRYLEETGFVPVTCKACGRGGHVSTNCPGRATPTGGPGAGSSNGDLT